MSQESAMNEELTDALEKIAEQENTIAALRQELAASERAKGIARCEWQSAQDKLAEIERNLIRITGFETDYVTNIETLRSERDELRSQNAKLWEEIAELKETFDPRPW